jgi:hypothetical protein
MWLLAILCVKNMKKMKYMAYAHQIGIIFSQIFSQNNVEFGVFAS